MPGQCFNEFGHGVVGVVAVPGYPGLQGYLLDGSLARADFLWAQWRVIGEADGRMKYETPEDLWREKLREDRLRELGYEVVRWTWDEIVNRPEVVVARILRAAERARRRG